MASNTLFVSNFPFTATEDDLRNAFAAHGEVRSVRIIVDRETGRSRGFAFVELVDEAAGDAAIAALNNCDFRGRRLVVSQARGRAGGAAGPGMDAPGARGSAGSTRARPAAPFRHRIVIDWDDGVGSYVASIPSLSIQTSAPTIEAAARKAETLGNERAAFVAEEDAEASGGEPRSSVRDA